MKLRPLPALPLLVAAALFSCKKNDPPPAVPVLQAAPVEAGLFGFNTGSTFHLLNPGLPFYGAAQDVAAHWLDSLDCRSFRFPGGRDANFYHYDGKGYGFRPDEFEVGASDEETALEVATQVFAHEAEYPDGVNAGSAYAEMASRQSGHRSIFTLNILHASYEENRDAILWLRSIGAEFDGFELGNETYLAIHRDDFPTAQDYIARAKDWATRLRADFPGLPIAVCGAPVKRQEGAAQAVFFRDWNEALSHEGFFDAVTWHYYVSFDPGCGTDRADPAAWACLRDSMVRETGERLPIYLDFWRSKFPGKKLWLTEWNLGKGRVEWLSSQACALFVAAFELELVRFSAQNGGFIEFAHHHNLLANGKFSVLTPDGDASGSLDKARRSPGFLAFASMKHLFDGSAQWLGGAGELFGFVDAEGNPLVAEAFFIKKPGGAKAELAIHLLNPTDAPAQFSWKQTGGASFKIGSKTWGSTGFSSKTTGFKSDLLSTGQSSEAEIERIGGIETGNFSVPARCVLVVRLAVE